VNTVNQRKSMVTRKNDPKQIWFLTALWYELIAYNEEHNEYKTMHETRTFGYYRGWSKAYQAVKENRSNMYECLYSYLVMERIGEGVHALPTDEQWFRWGGNRWVACKKPTALQGLTNWALG